MMRILQINLHAEEDCDDLSPAEKQRWGTSIYFPPKISYILSNIQQETIRSLT